MLKKQLFTLITLIGTIVLIFILPVGASAQYYYDNSGYQPYGYIPHYGSSAYQPSYYAAQPSYYGYYSAQPSYYYSQPSYYNTQTYYSNGTTYNNLGYSPYANYTRHSGRDTRTSTEELRYLTDLEGNRIGSYKRSGNYYRPNFGDYSSSSSSSSSSTSTSTKIVDLEDDEFSPKTITVKKGTTVKWVNRDHHSNTVSGDNYYYYIDSERLDYGDTYSKTFNTVGTYSYHSSYHKSMKGKVVVTNN